MLDLSRREWAGTLLASAVAAPARLRAATASSQFVVIGAGVFGAWTAYLLRRAGQQVTLVDQYGPANSRASSGGETRIIRASYGPDRIYSRMVQRSLGLWKELFEKEQRPLFHQTGVLWLAKTGDPRIEQSRAILRELKIPVQDLSANDLRHAYPQIQLAPNTMAIFEPESGALMAREATQAVVRQFVKEGGLYVHAAAQPPATTGTQLTLKTTEGETLTAETYVFACGAWLGKLFPGVLGKRIFPSRQDVLFFGIPPGDTSFEPPRMPVWIDFSDDRGMYGFPDIETRGFKVAFDLHGQPIDPDSAERVVSAEKIAAARVYLRDRFPALASMPVVDSRVCPYENTSNGDFLIDRHPQLRNVWLVGGGSGHGFKHGPAVGEYTVARLLNNGGPAVEPRFSLASKQASQSRAVY